jgi:hypothetical protein
VVIKSRFLNQSSESTCAGLSTNFSYTFSGPAANPWNTGLRIWGSGVRISFRRIKDFNKVCYRPLVSSQKIPIGKTMGRTRHRFSPVPDRPDLFAFSIFRKGLTIRRDMAAAL